MERLSIDIFCRVVDNFGDIGVCWRLAKQLAHTSDVNAVRLWVDDLRSFAHIEPQVSPGASLQTRAGVDIVHWTTAAPDLTPHEVVIEAFACDPPRRFIDQMIEQNSLWINLEYLSAEPWVESCHALPSLQANGLSKAFFFPGFTPATGGLLREKDLLADRDAWLADSGQRRRLLRDIGLPEAHIAQLHMGARQVLLFAYPKAPTAGLLNALSNDATPSIILVPSGVCPELARGQYGSAYVHDIPFVSQPDFDRLLWSSDLNCVRGEDSLVRALWAGKPLLWHIYPQEDDAHMTKLNAWLALSPFRTPVADLMQAWNQNDDQDCDTLLQQALAPSAWALWRDDSTAWSHQLAQQPDLTSQLIAFIKTHGKNAI